MAYNNVISRTDANALIPEDVVDEMLTNISEQSSVLRLSRRLRNGSRKQQRLPILDALPTASFVDGDSGKIETSEVNWTNKYIDYEKLGVIVPIPNDVLEDADYDIWEEIRPLCETAAMQAIDKAIIHGTNKPSSWPTAIAVDAAAKSHSVDLSTQIAAGEDMYDVLLGEDGIISLIEQDGYMATGHVASMSMRGKLRGVREKVYDGSGTANLGRSLFMPSMQGAGQYQLDGEPIVFPRNGGLDASSVLHIAGQWDQLVYSFRKEISYTMLTQSVIQDAGGNIIYNLAQQDMVALRMVLRMGWQLPNPPNYVNETASTRYPFAILVP